MSSITAILRKKQNQQGLFPVCIRITVNRKSTFIYTGYYIKEENWDDKLKKVKKNHANSVRLNNFLAKKIAEANDKLIESDTIDDNASATLIKKKITKNGKDFFAIANNYLDNLKSNKKFNQHSADKSRIDVFKEFISQDKFYIQSIDVQLLNNFQTYLISKKELSPRTVVNYLIVIRTIYNIAINEGLCDRKYYPFGGKDKIQIRFPESMKIGLSIEEVKKIEELDLEINSTIWHTRNVWLFCFSMAGIRIGDGLRMRWTEIRDGRLLYRMGKNQKVVTLKISDKVKSILAFYESQKLSEDDYIFPELKVANQNDIEDINRKIKNATRLFNKNLKKIAEQAKINVPISNHIARHTFGNISGDKIPVQLLQKLYRHSSITTTINYQANFINKDLDDALENVTNF